MIILIGENNLITREKIFKLKSICDIKSIKSNNNILFILNTNIDSSGLIEEDIMLDELLISLNIDYIITNTVNKTLERTSKYYNIPLIMINC